jgi:hypothetical protein
MLHIFNFIAIKQGACVHCTYIKFRRYLCILFVYLSVVPSPTVTDLEILVVLVTRLLRRDLNRLVNGIEPVEPWDEG